MSLMVLAMKAKVGNPLRKLVLIKLADNANDKGECWPSYQHIADQCEMSKSTVRKHIKDLSDSGFLWVENRKGPKGNTSNLYHLTLHPMPSENTPMPSNSTGGMPSDDTRTYHSYEPINEPIAAKAGKKLTKAELLAKKVRDNSEVYPALNCIDDELLLEWSKLRTRKGASDSDRALKRIEATLETLRTTGNTAPDYAISKQCDAGWTTVEVDYFVKSSGPTGQQLAAHQPQQSLDDVLNRAF
tara:strand:+ start:20193 stop:20921 length:729 start_codon:yes stop_codon:yes gene_type:complete